jgi:hypothetical protein
MTSAPIPVADAVTDDTKYLNTYTAAGSAASAIVASGGKYYDSSPILAWTGCVGAGSALGPYGGTPNLVPPGFLFADVSQGSTNMCTSIACANAYALKYAVQYKTALAPTLSATYAYYFQRAQECAVFGVCKCGSCVAPACTDPCDPPCEDCGSFLRSAVAVFAKGVATTAAWPNSVSAMNTLPSPTARLNALSFQLTGWQCVQGTTPAFVTQLSSGNPVVVILYVTPTHMAWMTAQTTAARTATPPTMPPPASAPTSTAHAVVLVAYNGTAFTARNNFGNSWGGAGGYFYIPSSYIGPSFVHSAVAFVTVCGPTNPADFTSPGVPTSTSCAPQSS